MFANEKTRPNQVCPLIEDPVSRDAPVPVGLGTSRPTGYTGRTGYQSDWVPVRLGIQSDWVPVRLGIQSDWVVRLGTGPTGYPVPTG